MSLFSPLLIACFDREAAEQALLLAKALGFPDAHIVDGGIAEAITALNARTTSPDYLLIDCGDRTSEILPQLDELAQHCTPDVRVVAVGTTDDMDFQQGLMERGVLAYFLAPADPAEIHAVLVEAPLPPPADMPIVLGTVVSCMSAASGDGASTLALNLAYCLAQQHKQKVVIVDMDYQFGLICKSLDLAAPFGIRELFDYPERGLDDLLISKMLVHYKDNLSIIAAPGELRLLPVIHPEIIRELIALLRTKFSFIVLDIPHVWTDWTAAALTYSDQVIMVGQLWLRSITHASRLLVTWQAMGIRRESISVVINRSGAKFKEAISARDFERICHCTIDAYVNNDVKAVTQAEKDAQTIFETGHGTLVTQQIGDLARSIMERHRPQPEDAKRSRSSRGGLFSFSRSRKG